MKSKKEVELDLLCLPRDHQYTNYVSFEQENSRFFKNLPLGRSSRQTTAGERNAFLRKQMKIEITHIIVHIFPEVQRNELEWRHNGPAKMIKTRISIVGISARVWKTAVIGWTVPVG